MAGLYSMATLDVKHGICGALSEIGAVESIHVLSGGPVWRVYTVVNDDDDEIFDQIYGREQSIIRSFTDAHFDFNVIVRRGRPVEELLSLGAPAWQREPL
jgi:hypothetical protein